jgi:hypothetical protein
MSEEKAEPDSEWLSKQRALVVAQEAGRAAAIEVTQMMGVDLTDGEAVTEAQKDFAHLRRSRQTQEAVKVQGLKVLVSSIIVASLGALWLGLKDNLHK